jgi:phospholipase/lecithinase/hemolysin
MNVSLSSGGLRRAQLPVLVGLLVFAFTSILGASASEAPKNQTPPFNAVYVIGDSLSDTGRTSAVLTQVFGTATPPPPYAPGRMSNGPLWIEHFTPMLGRAYQPLDNFAWAGANTGDTNVYPGLPGMFQQLAELRTPVTHQLNKNALYVVFGGANDFFQIFGGANPVQVISSGVTNIIQIVSNLRAAGAENIVVVDLPDIGRIPRAANFSGTATYLSTLFNGALHHALNNLGFPVVRVSLFNLINDFVTQPDKYGFTNVTGMGLTNLANADTYLFWDDVHPTTRAHRFVAEEVYAAVKAAGLIKHPLQ